MLAGLQELVQFENKLCSSFASFFLGLLFGFLWLRGFYFVAVRPAVAGSRRRDGTGRSRSINLWWLVVFASSWWTCIFFPCPLAVFFIHTGVLGMMPVGRATQMQALLDVCRRVWGLYLGWGSVQTSGPVLPGGYCCDLSRTPKT